MHVLPPPVSPPVSPVIDDKYRIISELGRGGMGIVYEALHLGLGHRVAVKFLTGPHAQNPSVVARFAREARAGANIPSEHVTRVFDLGITCDNVPYLVMELLEGDDLANVLEHHPVLRISDAVRFGREAARAMAEAHAIGIVHRDLKPENLFLVARRGAPPMVKILDFGLAKIRSHVDAAKTASEIVFGTPKYMAPEQLRSTADSGPEADIWSLGIILYQMLAGRRPFDGPNLSVIVAEILTRDPPPLRDLRPEVPPALEATIQRCMSRLLEERPTATELAELLGSSAPESGADANAQSFRRSRSPAAGIARLAMLGVVLFLAGLALASVHSRGHSAPPGVTSRRLGA